MRGVLVLWPPSPRRLSKLTCVLSSSHHHLPAARFWAARLGPAGRYREPPGWSTERYQASIGPIDGSFGDFGTPRGPLLRRQEPYGAIRTLPIVTATVRGARNPAPPLWQASRPIGATRLRLRSPWPGKCAGGGEHRGPPPTASSGSGPRAFDRPSRTRSPGPRSAIAATSARLAGPRNERHVQATRAAPAEHPIRPSPHVPPAAMPARIFVGRSSATNRRAFSVFPLASLPLRPI